MDTPSARIRPDHVSGRMSNNEKISQLTEILHDSSLNNAVKFDLMEEILLGGKHE